MKTLRRAAARRPGAKAPRPWRRHRTAAARARDGRENAPGCRLDRASSTAARRLADACAPDRARCGNGMRPPAACARRPATTRDEPRHLDRPAARPRVPPRGAASSTWVRSRSRRGRRGAGTRAPCRGCPGRSRRRRAPGPRRRAPSGPTGPRRAPAAIPASERRRAPAERQDGRAPRIIDDAMSVPSKSLTTSSGRRARWSMAASSAAATLTGAVTNRDWASPRSGCRRAPGRRPPAGRPRTRSAGQRHCRR